MFRTAIRLFFVALFVVCARPAAAQTTALFFDSQPGDYIGGGRQQTWTSSELAFQADGDFSRVRISATRFSGSSSVWWDLNFKAPGASALAPGTYEHASRYPFQPSSLPGLDVSGDGRGCNRLVGRFVIHEITWRDGRLDGFAADFEQHCEGATAALFGVVRYNSQRASLDPFDGGYPEYRLRFGRALHGHVAGEGILCGGEWDQCTATYPDARTLGFEAFPHPGYVFLGWAGDCDGVNPVIVTVDRPKICTPVFSAPPGTGLPEEPSYADSALFLHVLPGSAAERESRRVWTGAIADITPASTSPSSVTFSLATATEWTPWMLIFRAAEGGTLAAGAYDYAETSGVTRPWLRVGSCGRGRFRIHEIAFVGNTLSRFAADFEALCGLTGRIVSGSVRYRSTRSSLLPFGGDYPAYVLRVAASLGGHVSGPGIDCGAGRLDCEERYSSSAGVPVFATPQVGYDFVGWTGSCAGVDRIASVTVATIVRCVAVFQPSIGADVPADPSFGEATMFFESGNAGSLSNRRLWLAQDSRLSVSDAGSSVQFTAESGAADSLRISFRAPAGRLSAGDYEDTSDSPQALGPVLQVSFCGGRGGRFRVYEATYDENEHLITFAADFEGRCGSESRLIVAGAIRYRARRAVIRPFDGAYPIYKLIVSPAPNGVVTSVGIACGPGQADCSGTFGGPTLVSIRATPLPGYRFVGWSGACEGGSTTRVAVMSIRTCSAVFNAESPGAGAEDGRTTAAALAIAGESGDWVSQGQRRVWLGVAVDGIYARPAYVSASVFLPDGDRWRIEFRPPAGGTIVPGVYEDAVSPFYIAYQHRTAVQISSPQTGNCGYAATGRFVVYEISFSSTGLTSLAADFEQRCSPTAPALRGAIRFNSSRSQLIPFDTATSGGCTTADPYLPDRAGICTGGVWHPPSPFDLTLPPIPAAGCLLPDPFAALGGGTCYNGDWFPPGMTPPDGGVGGGTPPPATPTGCGTPDPFVALGGGTCHNGDWFPPGMPIPGTGGVSPPPPSPPPPTPTGCGTPDPFVALGGGTCHNGNWYPPGMAIPSPPPPTAGCVGPDPFIGIPGLIGVCQNGDWKPVPR